MSIRNFERSDELLSLCGLNCGLCGYRLQGSCGGCFKDSPCAAVCTMAPCSVRHGGLQYCFECPEYPCDKYDGFDSYDTLILHRNQRKDMLKAKEIGIEAYHDEQRRKMELLNKLLDHYDDGSRRVFCCFAVNLLEVRDTERILEQLESETAGLSVRERAVLAEQRFKEFADENGFSIIDI